MNLFGITLITMHYYVLHCTFSTETKTSHCDFSISIFILFRMLLFLSRHFYWLCHSDLDISHWRNVERIRIWHFIHKYHWVCLKYNWAVTIVILKKDPLLQQYSFFCECRACKRKLESCKHGCLKWQGTHSIIFTINYIKWTILVIDSCYCFSVLFNCFHWMQLMK